MPTPNLVTSHPIAYSHVQATFQPFEVYLSHHDVLSSSTEVEQSCQVFLWLRVTESGVCSAFHQSNGTKHAALLIHY